MRLLVVLVVVMACISMVPTSPEPVQAQDWSYTWSEPVVLSLTSNGAWFPDVAADQRGKVHVIWEGGLTRFAGLGSASGQEVMLSAIYTVWDGSAWSEVNDVYSDLVPSGAIYRLALATDGLKNLYMTVKPPTQNLMFTYSPIESAGSARAWSEPKPLSTGGVVYMSDIAVDYQGTIHVVWQEMVPVVVEGAGQFELFDIFYRSSEDGGQTWSEPINLSNTPVHEGRAQIKTDGRGTIYVTWDEGGRDQAVVASGSPGVAFQGVLRFSQDGGKTWTPCTKFSYPNRTNSQMAVMADGRGGVLAVWRSAEGVLYYDWSTDAGISWDPPAIVPRILAYSYNGFDAYDMAVDSDGTIHLVASGQLPQGFPSRGIYHLAWDGKNWSSPSLIYASDGRGQDPLVGMYPKIAVSQGNQLHVVWHTHAERAYLPGRYVWYSTSRSPALPVLPAIEPTLPAPTAVPTIVAVSTPSPGTDMPVVPASDFDPRAFYTENDDVLRLMIGLVPTALVISIIFLVRRSRRR
jgi:hypothetical protein